MAKLVLVDLDKTLIGPDYHVTVPDGESLVAQTAQRCREKGIEIGLASDTPIIALRDWAGRFNFTGPIVAELGACVQLPSGTVVSTRADSSPVFAEMRQVLVQKMLDHLPDTTILVGDGTTFIRTFGNIGGQILSFLTEKVVLVNGLRTNSLAFHVRRFDRPDNVLVRDDGLLRLIVAVLEQVICDLGLDSEEFQVDYHPDYGICIAHLRGTCKTNGIVAVLDAGGDRYEGSIVMIGDSMGDLITHPRVIHCGVSNATVEFKEHCLRVAAQPMTAGVLELLEQILKGEIG